MGDSTLTPGKNSALKLMKEKFVRCNMNKDRKQLVKYRVVCQKNKVQIGFRKDLTAKIKDRSGKRFVYNSK